MEAAWTLSRGGTTMWPPTRFLINTVRDSAAAPITLVRHWPRSEQVARCAEGQVEAAGRLEITPPGASGLHFAVIEEK